jgi:histone H1/5
MAKAKAQTFEEKLLSVVKEEEAATIFSKEETAGMDELEPIDLWMKFYNLIAAHESEYAPEHPIIDLANECADKEAEWKAFQKTQKIAGEDVTLPKKGAAKQQEEPKGKEVVLPPKKKRGDAPPEQQTFPLPEVVQPTPERKNKKNAVAPKKVPAPAAKKVAKKVDPAPVKNGNGKNGVARKAESKPFKVIEKLGAKEEKKVVAKKATKKAVPVKASPAPKKVVAKKAAKKPREVKLPIPKDRFGFRQGSAVSVAASLMNGEFTLLQIAKKMGLKQNLYYMVNRIEDKGHRVEFKNSKVTVYAAKKKKE